MTIVEDDKGDINLRRAHEVPASDAKHIFVCLVQVRDNKDLLPEPWPALLQEVLDFLWDDELRHYQEQFTDDLDDKAAIQAARDEAEGN